MVLLFIFLFCFSPQLRTCMAADEEAASKVPPLIVAMKGHPATGKSTVARALAAALRCPLLDKDDVRDSTFSLRGHVPPDLLNDLSYNVVWRVAATQLRLGLSLVLDSPLSRRAHLDRLRDLASESGARLLVVECRPSDQVEWRLRLEQRGAASDASWHKPSTWEDLQRLLERYDGCYDYDAGDVPKLVLDTTAPGEQLSVVLNFIRSFSVPQPRTGSSSSTPAE